MILSKRKVRRLEARQGLLGISLIERAARIPGRPSKIEKGSSYGLSRNNNQTNLQNTMFACGYSRLNFRESLQAFKDTGASIPESRVSKTANTEYMYLKKIQLGKTLLKMQGIKIEKEDQQNG